MALKTLEKDPEASWELQLGFSEGPSDKASGSQISAAPRKQRQKGKSSAVKSTEAAAIVAVMSVSQP